MEGRDCYEKLCLQDRICSRLCSRFYQRFHVKIQTLMRACLTQALFVFSLKIKFAKITSPFMRGRTKIARTFSFAFKKGGLFVKSVVKKSSPQPLERNFQATLIKELKKLFDGCLVMKSDSGYIQGIPDLLVLYKNKWASLECKKSARASKRPNQEYYVNLMNNMSFSRFISPENKESVLDALAKFFNS